MKLLSKKDYVITVLFFLLALSASSLSTPAMILKDISYQAILSQNPIMFVFSGMGYLLTLPILMIFITPIHFLGLFGVGVAFDGFYVLIPIATALIYSLVLMFLLAMYNGRNKKRASQNR